MTEHPDYAVAWRDYRRRRRIFFLIFLGGLPWIYVLYGLIGVRIAALTGIKPGYFFWPIVGSWVLAWLAAQIRLMLFRCPRCNNLFHYFRGNIVVGTTHSRRCMNCGLPRWATPETAPHSN
jgi:hypothetical protein